MPSAPAQLAFIGLDSVQPALTTDRAEDHPVPSTITGGPEPDLAAYDLILELAEEPGGPEPGVVLDEDGPEFAALEAAVRAQLAEPVKLRASTDFTTVPLGCLSCTAC